MLNITTEVAHQCLSTNAINNNREDHTEIKAGSKYDKNLDIAQIAKMVRADLKQAVKEGKLPEHKVSVRVRRYAGGQSLDVAVTQCAALGSSDRDEGGVRKPQAMFMHTVMSQIIAAYNYDNSDLMTDYFDVNFYGHVEFNLGA